MNASEILKYKRNYNKRPCAVYNCKFQGNQKIARYSFPKDDHYKKLWIDFCGRKDDFSTIHSKICERHFSQANMKRDLKAELLGIVSKKNRPLRDDAVPDQNFPLKDHFCKQDSCNRNTTTCRLNNILQDMNTSLSDFTEDNTSDSRLNNIIQNMYFSLSGIENGDPSATTSDQENSAPTRMGRSKIKTENTPAIKTDISEDSPITRSRTLPISKQEVDHNTSTSGSQTQKITTMLEAASLGDRIDRLIRESESALRENDEQLSSIEKKLKSKSRIKQEPMVEIHEDDYDDPDDDDYYDYEDEDDDNDVQTEKEPPRVEFVSPKGVMVCEFGTQTDFDPQPEPNNLNLFYCSVYNNNEVSTYCNLTPQIPRVFTEKSIHNDYIKHNIKTFMKEPRQMITPNQATQTSKTLLRSIIFEEARNIIKNDNENEKKDTKVKNKDPQKNPNPLSMLVQNALKKIPSSFVTDDYPIIDEEVEPRVTKPEKMEEELEEIDVANDCEKFYDFNKIQVETEDEKKVFKCLGCCVNLTSSNELIQHVKNNHYPKNIALRCNRCPVAFPLAFQLQDHKEQIHGESHQIKCGFCNKSFSETRIYIRHVMLRHAKKTTKFTVRCQTCSVVCKNMKVYRKHQIIHMREAQFKSLNTRTECDSEAQLFNCKKCDRSFNTEYSLTLHNAHKHKSVTSKVCQICCKEFKKPSLLKYHMDWHYGIKRPSSSRRRRKSRMDEKNECHICYKSDFLTRKALHNHLLRIHKVKTEEMNYLQSCNLCGKEFVYPRKIKIHMERHNKPLDKSYKSQKKNPNVKLDCNLCGKRLSTPRSLRNHMTSVHFRDRCKFSCPVCGKRFSSKGNLNEHIPIHNAIKPHACNECGTRFTTTGNLRHHIRSVHGVPVKKILADGSVQTQIIKMKRGPRKPSMGVVEGRESEMSVDERNFYISL